ncbi:MAG: hypothetical protein ABIE94_04280 [archaeon]
MVKKKRKTNKTVLKKKPEKKTKIKAVKKKAVKKKTVKKKAAKKTNAVKKASPSVSANKSVTLDSGKEVLQIAMMETPELAISEPEPMKKGKQPKFKLSKSNKVKKTVLKKGTSPDRYFILCNGRRLKNIKELADIMEEIEDHVFNHHVTHDKNDFAKWVHDVFQDIDLAQKIAGVKDKKHVQFIIYKHITHNLW